jgi:hypothetical protein
MINDNRGQRQRVASIEGWKKRQAPETTTAPAGGKLVKENVRLLSRAQKQAALLRLILSDTITEAGLDAMIEAGVSLVSRRK